MYRKLLLDLMFVGGVLTIVAAAIAIDLRLGAITLGILVCLLAITFEITKDKTK